MPWFKVDDKLHDHRKARAAGTNAMGVWVLAGSWAADNLTDGFIPASILPRWGKPRDAAKLVEVGLWQTDTQDGEQGWRFHEWTERQPSRAQKLAERQARAQAGRSGGLASGRSRREANTQANTQANTEQIASPLLEPPSRPDPSRPEPEADEPSAPRRKRPATTLPANWEPTDEHHTRAQEAGINIHLELDSFRAHADTHDRRCVNWNAAFTQWLLKAKPTDQPRQGAAAQWLRLAADLGDDTPMDELRGGGGR